MTALLQFTFIVLGVGFSLMGLAFALGHLIAWHKSREFRAYLKYLEK